MPAAAERGWCREQQPPSRALAWNGMAADPAEEPCSRCGQEGGREALQIRPGDEKEEVQAAVRSLHVPEEGLGGVRSRPSDPVADRSEMHMTDSEEGRTEGHSPDPSYEPGAGQPAARSAVAGCCSSYCPAGPREVVGRDAGQDCHPCRLCLRNTSLKRRTGYRLSEEIYAVLRANRRSEER